MRVMFYTRVNPRGKGPLGGAETSMLLMAKLLAKEDDIRVTYLCHDSEIYLKQKKKIDGVHFINLGRKYVANTFIRAFKKRLDIRLWKKVMRLEKPDVVYIHDMFITMEQFYSLKQEFGFRLVLRMAGLKTLNDLKAAKHSVSEFQKYLNCADVINCLSPQSRVEVLDLMKDLKLTIHKESIRVLDVGVNLKQLNQFAKKELANRKDVIMVSRFTKRQDLLVKAIHHLKSENIPFPKLHLMGEGGYKESLLKQVKDLGLEDHVFFIPFKEQKQMWKYLSQMDALLHATDSEGVSKVILEAMALRLPVYASNVSPINTYVKDGENGILVNNDHQSWGLAIEKFMTIDAGCLNKVTSRAYEYVMDSYDAGIQISKYKTLFKELVELKEV